MSRIVIYQDQKMTLVTGHDHIVGDFIQLYDKELRTETPEGEGLIFDWSQGFGIEVNLTDIDLELNPMEICLKCIEDSKTYDDNINGFI